MSMKKKTAGCKILGICAIINAILLKKEMYVDHFFDRLNHTKLIEIIL